MKGGFLLGALWWWQVVSRSGRPKELREERRKCSAPPNFLAPRVSLTLAPVGQNGYRQIVYEGLLNKVRDSRFGQGLSMRLVVLWS